MSEKKKEPSAIGWLLDQAGEHRGQYAASVALAIAGVLCSVAPYFAVAGIVRAMMAGQKDMAFYLQRCVLMAVLWLGRVLFHALSTSTSHRATFAVLAEIRKRGMEKLTRMPLGDVLAESTGALKNTLIERIDAIETTLAHIVPEFTANLLVPLIIIIYIFTIDWRMGLASLLTVPLGLACYVGMMTGSAGFYERTVKATKALNATAVEYINGIQVIKVFGKTKSSYERFAADAKEAAASFVDWMRSSIIPFTFAMVIMPATMVSILPVGGLLVRAGKLGTPDFIYIIILSVGLITPLITCMSYSDDIRTMGTIVGEVRRIVEAPEMNRPQTGTAPADNTLKLEDVHFSYGEKEVLHGIDMEIPEGSYTALVGPSGSGKSTIARLIASLWEADSGRILLGGKDLREIPLDVCADRVAFVSQDNYLFNMSVRENIRLGRPEATDAEVEEAARMSGCHAFILSLENGYDTMVGSSGSHLSGGERQRISIARAMLKAAPIVILDEATAYTDPENEAVIQRSVSRLTEGKTLIVIAHRLSTIRDADRIYVIRDGLVDDAGTHEELMEHHGLYETMYRAHMAARDQEVSVNG
ncbi:MAG: ABC transporter ATP-binding protein [Solobacterium sp.]|nr:ABC transporter ATP-binding protein [Solobacterium sp.]